MDPKILPMVEQVCTAGPVARFQVQHASSSSSSSGPPSVVDTIEPDELAPLEIATRIWDAIDGDALMHDGPAVYWIVAYRNAGDSTPIRRLGVKTNVDKLAKPSRLVDNPLAKMIDVQAAQLEQKDTNLLTAFAIIGRQAAEGKDFMLRQLERADRRLEMMAARELETMTLMAELLDRKDQRKLEEAKTQREAKLFGKIEDMGLLLLGEAMGEKDGKLASVVERRIMQEMVDNFTDADIEGILERGEIKLPSAEKRTQLLRMLQPYLEEALRKKQAKAAEDAAAAAAKAAAGERVEPVETPAPAPAASSGTQIITTTGESIQ